MTVLGILGLGLAMPTLDRRISLNLKSEALALQSRLQGKTGLLVGFQSLSPSILRGLDLRGLEVRNPQGRIIVSARKASLSYDLGAALGLWPGEVLKAINLDDADLSLGPEDLALFKSLAPATASAGTKRVPAIALKGSRIRVALHDFSSGDLELGLSSFRLTGQGEELSLSFAGSFKAQSLGFVGPVEAQLQGSGSLGLGLDRARLRLRLSATSQYASLKPQTFELVVAPGALDLRKVEDRAPIDALIHYDASARLLSVDLRMEAFHPKDGFTLSRAGALLKPWLDLPYTGQLTLALPLDDPQALSYSGQLVGRLPSALLGDGYEVEVTARGDLKTAIIQKAQVLGPMGRVEYSGSYSFASRGPQGRLSLDLRLAKAALPLKADFLLGTERGVYAAHAPRVSLGDLDLRDFSLEAKVSGSTAVMDVTCLYPEAGLPEGHSLKLRADLGWGRSPKLRGSIEGQGLGLREASSVLQAFLSPSLAALAENLVLSGRLELSSSSGHLAYSSQDLRIGLRDRKDLVALVSFSGTEKRLDLEKAQVGYGAIEGSAKGSAEFSPGAGLGFGVQLSLGGQSYDLAGSLAGGVLHGRGSYGLAFSSRTVEGEVFLSAEAQDLPLPGVPGPASLSFSLDGRYTTKAQWSLALSSLKLGWGGQGATASLSGIFGPTEAKLTKLGYRDGISEVLGQGRLGYASESPLSFDATLQGPRGEAYGLSGTYGSGGLDARVKASASPLERLGSLPVSGLADLEIRAKGSLESLGLEFSLSLAKARLQGEALSLRASGRWQAPSLEVSGLSASWKSYEIKAATVRANALTGAASFDGGASVLVNASALASRLVLQGACESLDRPGPSPGPSPGPAPGSPWTALKANLPDLSALKEKLKTYTLTGKALAVAYRDLKVAEWPMTLGIGEGEIAFVGGKGDLTLQVRRDGNFALEAKEPFPLAASLTGHVTQGGIDATLRNFSADLPLVANLIGYLPVKLSKGRVSGDLEVHGPLAKPDMEGLLQLTGVYLSVPGWVETEVGPLSAPVEVSGKSLAFSALAVPAGDAKLAIEGSATLLGWIPGDLVARATTLKGAPLKAEAQVLGIKAAGEAFIDLTIGYSGGIASVDGSVALQKAKISINPAGFSRKSSSKGPHSTYFDVNVSLSFGSGVRVYFPSPDIPVVMGYADPASAIRLRYNQETGDLGVKGTAFLRGGEVFYIQRDFFLKQARIDFNETEDKFDPLITLQAERRARTESGTAVLISLTADKQALFALEPKLSSDPSLTEGQIASLLGASLIGAEASSGNVDLLKAAIAGSELIPQLNVAKAFEERVREALGVDMFFVQTQVVQRWLYEISGAGDQGSSKGGLAAYLDDTSIYLGKYFGDNIFLHAQALLQRDPLVPSGPLLLNSEFGVELEAPFGTLKWTITPKTPESLFISDQSLSLTYKLQL